MCLIFAQADVVNEYCKLRCTSSVCGPLTTLQNSGKIKLLKLIILITILLLGIIILIDNIITHCNIGLVLGASEIGDGAVEDCAKACSGFCTNGSTKLAVETA